MSARLRFFLCIYLLALFSFIAVWLWGWWRLPEGVIATHFNAQGQPNGYGTRADLLYSLIYIELGLQAIFLLLAFFTPRLPLWLFNIHPAWKAPCMRAQADAKIRELFIITASLISFDFAVIQGVVFASALAEELRFEWAIISTSVLTLIITIIAVVPLARAFAPLAQPPKTPAQKSEKQ